MNKRQIAELKKAVQEEFLDASRLQYHSGTDTISGYGRNLAPTRRAASKIDRYGYGRYVLAEAGYGKSWQTIHGTQLIDPDGKVVVCEP